MEMKNRNTWTIKKWQAILTLIILVGTILSQMLFAQGWKTNVERDIKDRPTFEESRQMIKSELLEFKETLKEIKNDIKDLTKRK